MKCSQNVSFSWNLNRWCANSIENISKSFRTFNSIQKIEIIDSNLMILEQKKKKTFPCSFSAIGTTALWIFMTNMKLNGVPLWWQFDFSHFHIILHFTDDIQHFRFIFVFFFFLYCSYFSFFYSFRFSSLKIICFFKTCWKTNAKLYLYSCLRKFFQYVYCSSPVQPTIKRWAMSVEVERKKKKK